MKKFRKIFRIVISLVMLLILGIAGYNISMKYLYPTEYYDHVSKYCDEFEVDRTLALAVINCESSFDPDAQSEKDAVGLMQLTEETFIDVRKMVGDSEELTFSQSAKDPEINIKYGTRYLRYLFEVFNGDKVAVIAAYNAGLGNVKKWMNGDEGLKIEDIAFPETRSYVEKVLKSEEHYESLINKW